MLGLPQLELILYDDMRHFTDIFDKAIKNDIIRLYLRQGVYILSNQISVTSYYLNKRLVMAHADENRIIVLFFTIYVEGGQKASILHPTPIHPHLGN